MSLAVAISWKGCFVSLTETVMNLLSYLTNCYLVAVGFLAGFTTGEDKILFRDEDDITFEDRNFLTAVKIPESLLIQMKDIQNITELFRRFVKKEEPTQPVFPGGMRPSSGTRPYVNGRRAFAPSPPAIAQPANCQPEEQVVEIDNPANGRSFLWPSCVRVKRCGGCCTSKMLICSPIATSTYNVTVLHLLYNPESPDTFVSQGPRVYALEQHDRCVCRCKETAESCNERQEYRQEECRCVCINHDQALKCTSPKKIWDSSECACKCRSILDCSTGSYFSPIKCRCESTKRSLTGNNFDRLTASLTDRSRPRSFRN